MRGTIAYLCDTYGKIEPFNTKESLYFSANSIIDLCWKELYIGMVMDFIADSSQASCVRKAPLKWLDGYIDSISTTPWGDTQWNIKTKHGARGFWFLKENALRLPVKEVFNIGDIVKFQCEGYTEKRNRAYNVTKQKLGYITNYDPINCTGMIDYSIPFAKSNIINYSEFCIDSSKYFYSVAYNISNTSPLQIMILYETPEIVFDDYLKYIDGYINIIGAAKNGEEYIIISPPDGSPCTIKTSFDAFDSSCDWKWIEPNQHISYVMNDEGTVSEISWTGYITRFPIHPASKDMSAQINSDIWRNEFEALNPTLIYCRKYKISNACYDEPQKNFWVETTVFNNRIQIPIKTYKTFQRYKVRYALTDDNVHTKKAIRISIIGIAKAPEGECKEVQQRTETADNVVINNYYAPVYQQVNFVQNILQIEGKSFADYLQNYYRQRSANLPILSVEPIECLPDTVSADLLADASLFEQQYSLALDFLLQKYNLSASSLHIEWLSDKCKEYLKTALIVDYKLMGEICLLSDLSAQSVFYGKFLEQLLKDVLFPLFKNSPRLSDKLTRLTANGIKEVTSPKQTTIGTYCNAISRHLELISEVLGNICTTKTIEEWKIYWQQLNNQLIEAKEIRNKTDHADQPICIQDVDKIRALIIAPDGIVATIEIVAISPEKEDCCYNEISADYLLFDYEKPLYGKNQNIQGLLGKVMGKPALLHISKLSASYVGQREIECFIQKIQKKPLSVKVFKETDKGIEVTLLGVIPDFDTLIR